MNAKSKYKKLYQVVRVLRGIHGHAYWIMKAQLVALYGEDEINKVVVWRIDWESDLYTPNRYRHAQENPLTTWRGGLKTPKHTYPDPSRYDRCQSLVFTGEVSQ